MPIDYKKNYPADWKTKIRPDILERAGNCCEECGVPNKEVIIRGEDCYQDMDGTIWSDKERKKIGEDYVGEVHPTNKMITIVLTIAHLDDDTTNNDYSNLRALCQMHHLRRDLLQHQTNSRITRNKKKKQIPINF